MRRRRGITLCTHSSQLYYTVSDPASTHPVPERVLLSPGEHALDCQNNLIAVTPSLPNITLSPVQSSIASVVAAWSEDRRSALVAEKPSGNPLPTLHCFSISLSFRYGSCPPSCFPSLWPANLRHNAHSLASVRRTFLPHRYNVVTFLGGHFVETSYRGGSWGRRCVPTIPGGGLSYVLGRRLLPPTHSVTGGFAVGRNGAHNYYKLQDKLGFVFYL